MTANRFVVNSLDDAYVFTPSSIVTTGFISAGEAGAQRSAAMLFRSILIPKGSIIKSAVITLRASSNQTGTVCRTRFYAESSVSPLQYSTYGDFTGRSLTTAFVDWTVPAFTLDTDYQTPDLTAIIQEVIDKADWETGKSIAIQWKDNGSDTNARRAVYGYEDTSLHCAQIAIEYTPPVRENVMNVALPGYNALTDTNLDHFSLYTNEDNVLIKEFTRGSISVGSGVDQTIPHNLGYVPFFLVFVNETSLGGSSWALVGIGSILSMLYAASADTTNLVISNFGASSRTFKYFIFYDNQVGSSGVTLSETKPVIKIAKTGFDALTEKDPNNLVFHSDLNSFKIVYQGKTTVNFNSGASDYSFPHHSPLTSTSSILLFAQNPDGKVTPVAWYGSQSNSCKSYSNLQGIDGNAFDGAYFDTTNIYMHNAGVVIAYDVVFVWYVFEASL